MAEYVVISDTSFLFLFRFIFSSYPNSISSRFASNLSIQYFSVTISLYRAVSFLFLSERMRGLEKWEATEKLKE